MNGTLLSNEGKRAAPALILPEASPRRWQPSREFLLIISLLGDLMIVFTGSSLGFWARFYSGWFPPAKHVTTLPDYSEYLNLLLLGTVFLIITFAFRGLYGSACFMNYLRVTKAVIKGTFFWLVAYLSISLILKFEPPISRLFMGLSFGFVTVGMLVWRLLFIKLMKSELLALTWKRRVLFIGWNQEATALSDALSTNPNSHYETIGCVASPLGVINQQPDRNIRFFGDYHNLLTLIRQNRVNVVILADPHLTSGEIIGMMNMCEREFVEFKIIPNYFQIMTSGLQLETISRVPLLGVSALPLSHTHNTLMKRGVDIVGAIVGLSLSLPLIVIFGALVYHESPGPILYRQNRMGKNGRNFGILKIRSMEMGAETSGPQWAKENDPRRLKVGAFMRQWNIDEVPQFWNVLKGEMSLVGPRPERPELIESFQETIAHYHARHSCLPGMTGWAQVNGWRGNTSLEERIRFDIWYVEHWSFELDFRIMGMTFFRNKNAY